MHAITHSIHKQAVNTNEPSDDVGIYLLSSLPLSCHLPIFIHFLMFISLLHARSQHQHQAIQETHVLSQVQIRKGEFLIQI